MVLIIMFPIEGLFESSLLLSMSNNVWERDEVVLLFVDISKTKKFKW